MPRQAGGRQREASAREVAGEVECQSGPAVGCCRKLAERSHRVSLRCAERTRSEVKCRAPGLVEIGLESRFVLEAIGIKLALVPRERPFKQIDREGLAPCHLGERVGNRIAGSHIARAVAPSAGNCIAPPLEADGTEARLAAR